MWEWACSPVGIAVVWLVLHAADYLLTVAVSRTYLRGDLRLRVDMGGGSIEMNPVFQRAVDRGVWISRRFVITWIGVAVLLFAGVQMLEVLRADEDGWARGGLLGALVVTRAVVITGHLHSLALFRRLLSDPAAAVVRLRYDRATLFASRRWSYLQSIVLCTLGCLVTPSPFFGGGLLAMLGLVGATFAWQRIDTRRRAAVPAPGDRAATDTRGTVASGGTGAGPPPETN